MGIKEGVGRRAGLKGRCGKEGGDERKVWEGGRG